MFEYMTAEDLQAMMAFKEIEPQLIAEREDALADDDEALWRDYLNWLIEEENF